MIDNFLRSLKEAVRRRPQQSLLQSDNDERLKFYTERDPNKNIDTAPPEDEFIDLCCVWGVEFYTPTHIEGLVKSFRKLGWRTDDHPDPSRDPEAWLYGLRRYQHGGAWLNLGFLTLEDSNSPWGSLRHTAPLPECVDYASVSIYSISPSLIAMVVCFVFKEDSSVMLDKALRKQRRTYTTPFGSGVRIHDPRQQKRDDISEIRSTVSKLAATWFSEYFPGLFSSGLLGGELPSCEFITLRNAEPFPSRTQADPVPQEYLRLLGLSYDYNAWRSTSIPGLKFGTSQETEHNPRYHSICAMKENECIEAITSLQGSSDRSSRIDYVGEMMPTLISLWAILPLLEGYTQYLNKVRDPDIFKPKTRLTPVNILEKLEDYVSYSVDIAAVTSELVAHSEELFPLIHRDEVFEPCNSEFYKTGYSLNKHLEYTIGKQATWLERTDKSLRDHLTQYGSLLGATENVRVQRKITCLTWALLALAGLTLITSPIAPGLWGFVQDILSYFSKLWSW